MTLMDLLLAMAEDSYHDVLWSDFLLDEWESVIVRERHRTRGTGHRLDHRLVVAEQASAITCAIRQAFPTGRIAPDNPDERVHGAAALAGGATALITANLRHFDTDFFARHGVVVETPESHLLRRLELVPDRLIETVRRVLTMKTQPRWTLASTWNESTGPARRVSRPPYGPVAGVMLVGAAEGLADRAAERVGSSEGRSARRAPGAEAIRVELTGTTERQFRTLRGRRLKAALDVLVAVRARGLRSGRLAGAVLDHVCRRLLSARACRSERSR